MNDEGGIRNTRTYPYTSHNNYSEIMIKTTKTHTLRIMHQRIFLVRLWEFSHQYTCNVIYMNNEEDDPHIKW